MYSIGLDIGTTSIGAVLINGSGKVTHSFTKANDAGIEGERKYEKLQDPQRILTYCQFLLEEIKALGLPLKCLGVTGQMHGILYLDEEGKAVSPLYSWQDQRGNEVYEGEESYASYLQSQTGYPMATGFGLSTHFVLTKTGKIPADAVVFCTIADYVALSLTKGEAPVLHPSMAASLGLFDLERKKFDIFGMEKIGMDSSFLPEVEASESILGTWEGIPVSMALGDNQASFLGSVGPGANVLVNIGTGSQVSCYVDTFVHADEMEIRPYIGGTYLLVASSLCGGYSYQLLHDFFKSTFEMFGVETPLDLYEYMNRVAQEASEQQTETTFVTRFNGTRQDPSLRAQWKDISSLSFTPQALCNSMLRGICTELFEPYEKAKEHLPKTKVLVASGNGVRKNKAMQKLCEDVFKLPLSIPAYGEEASIGSALFARLSMKDFASLEDLKTCIHYQ